MFESFLQDVRIGLRVLFKEKSFCFLAVLVLATRHRRRDHAIHRRQRYGVARVFVSSSRTADERRVD